MQVFYTLCEKEQDRKWSPRTDLEIICLYKNLSIEFNEFLLKLSSQKIKTARTHKSHVSQEHDTYLNFNPPHPEHKNILPSVHFFIIVNLNKL